MSEFNPANNKFLLLNPDCVRTPDTDVVICLLDKYFAMKNHKAFVTSIKRTPEKQLYLIRQAAIQKGLDKKYPEAMTCDIDEKDEKGYYKWQMLWSHLLNLGYIINPPIAAEVLMDYIDTKTGINKKGRIIPPSVHFYGLAFDIGGRGGSDKTVNDEVEVVEYAKSVDDELRKRIKEIKIERDNNCVHIGVKSEEELKGLKKKV